MEEAFGMDVFNSSNGLVGNKEDGFERELSAAIVEEVLERWAEEVVDQRVVGALLSKPSDMRYSHSAE